MRAKEFITETTSAGATGAGSVAAAVMPMGEVVRRDVDEDLKKWFKQKWVRFGPDGKIRGDCARGSSSEGKPKCLPRAKAQALGKKGRASAGARKRRQDPDAERSGKAINVKTKKKTNEQTGLDEACWKGYHKEGNKKMFGKTYPNCVKNKKTNEAQGIPFDQCPSCGGSIVHESELTEKQDACYHKVKSRYKVWPSAYASGALVQCRKKGAANWGGKSQASESSRSLDDGGPRTQRILRQLRAENPHATNDLEALIFDYRRSQSQDRSDISRLSRENDIEDAEIDALQQEINRLKRRREP